MRYVYEPNQSHTHHFFAITEHSYRVTVRILFIATPLNDDDDDDDLVFCVHCIRFGAATQTKCTHCICIYVRDVRSHSCDWPGGMELPPPTVAQCEMSVRLRPRAISCVYCRTINTSQTLIARPTIRASNENDAQKHDRRPAHGKKKTA